MSQITIDHSVPHQPPVTAELGQRAYMVCRWLSVSAGMDEGRNKSELMKDIYFEAERIVNGPLYPKNTPNGGNQ